LLPGYQREGKQNNNCIELRPILKYENGCFILHIFIGLKNNISIQKLKA
jgi:hypothetical protein